MPIILRLDRVMADRKMSLKELSEKVGVANVNLSKLKTGMSAPFAFPHWKPSAKRWTVCPAISWNIGKRRKKCHQRPDPPEIFQTATKLRRYITAGNGQDNLLQLFLLYTFSVIHFFRSYTLRMHVTGLQWFLSAFP